MNAQLHRPSWEALHAAGMSAQDAADAMGTTVDAAYGWARWRDLAWAKATYVRGGSLPTEQLLILHAEGKTAIEASAITGRSPRTLRAWASKRGLAWAHCEPAPRQQRQRVQTSRPTPPPAPKPLPPHVRRVTVQISDGSSTATARPMQVSLRKEPWVK